MRLLRAVTVHWCPPGPERETLPRFSSLGLSANLSFINKAIDVWFSQSVSEHLYGANLGDRYLAEKVMSNSSTPLADARAGDGLSPH